MDASLELTAGVSPWWMAVRPKTLTAAFVPILVATALAAGQARLWIAAFALLSSVFIQIGTNLINDALDFKRGADTAERLGPKRVTQSGLLSPRSVYAGGLACFALAVLLAAPLMVSGGWPIAVIAASSVVCGYLYTGGPKPLAYAGLGDLFVFLFFGCVAVAGMSWLYGIALDGRVAVAGAQVGCLSTVMIAINNLRDHVTDAQAGKRTLAVRLGPGFVRAEITALVFIPFLLGVFWWRRGAFAAALLPLLALPLAWGVQRGVSRTEPSRRYNQFLAMASALSLAFALLLSTGLWL